MFPTTKILVLLVLSVPIVLCLKIEFKANNGIPVPSKLVQSLIIKSIEEGRKVGKEGQDLCSDHILPALKKELGGDWICFFGHTGAVVNWNDGENGIARFFLDGVKWIILKNNQVKKEDLNRIKKEVTHLKKQLESKQKEHDDYVKKIEATKSIIEKILQIKHSNGNQ